MVCVLVSQAIDFEFALPSVVSEYGFSVKVDIAKNK